MPKYFLQAFATAGDKAAIPEDIQPSGSVSYNQGFGFDYSRDQTTDSLAKDVPREETNQLYFDITDNIGFLQRNGAPAFVTSSDNGGAPLAYSLGAAVRWRANPGDPFRTYVSRIDSNTTDPSNATNWQLFNYQFALNADTVSVGIPVDPAYVTARLAGVTVTVPDASTTVKGIVELATNSETIALTDAVRAVTPAGLGAAETSRGWVTPQATTAVVGKTRYATGAEALAGVEVAAAVTPAALAAGVPAATTSVAGRTRYATEAETTAQVVSTAAVTPNAMGGYARLGQSVSFSNVSSSGGFDVTSSERVKRDLRANPYGLDAVLRIATCVGRYRQDYNSDPREHVFLIAEDLAQIVPLAVRDGLANYNGEPIPTVNYDMIVPVLVRAVQQENAQRRAGERTARIMSFTAVLASILAMCAYAFGG